MAACSILLVETPSAESAPCAAGAPTGWKTYADQIHGFCFSYPPIFSQSPVTWLDNRLFVQKTTRKSRLLALQDVRFKDSGILVLFDDIPFDLQTFPDFMKPLTPYPYWGAPLGIESPPGQIKAGDNTFYVYRGGAGGVCYPDKYYFNLKGKLLRIIFTEKCANDRIPPPETHKLELQILATLQTFKTIRSF